MSFSQKIKKEILTKLKYKKEEIVSFLTGLILVSSKFYEKEDEYIIRINREDISFMIKEKIVKLGIKYYTSPKNKNWIIILKKDFDLKKEIINGKYFFAGAFVGNGLISSLNSTYYHLEISSYYEEIVLLMQKKMNSYNFNFQIIKRNEKYILYIKKIENILDFLAAIGAYKNFQDFFDIKNERDIQNNINRLVNLDLSNQQKLVNASLQHIDLFKKIKKENKLNFFTEEELIFFTEKEKNPNLSLNEMVEHLFLNFKIKKTKSGLNHWLIKLKKIAKEN